MLTKNRNKAINLTSKIINENVKSESERQQNYEELKEIFPTAIERFNMHNYFNGRLKNNFNYFDINNDISDPEMKGHVDINFIPARIDHHLVDSLFVRNLHVKKLLDTISDF